MSQPLPFPEAPASATFKFVDPATGGEVMFTLRDSDGVSLLHRVQAALTFLCDQGAVIVPPRGPLSTRFADARPVPMSGAVPLAMANGDAPHCQKHGAPIRESKWGGFYCAMADETAEKGYCTHKVSKRGKYTAA